MSAQPVPAEDSDEDSGVPLPVGRERVIQEDPPTGVDGAPMVELTTLASLTEAELHELFAGA